VETNLNGYLSNPANVDSPTLARLGYTNQGVADCIQSIKITNADVTLTDNGGGANYDHFIDIEDNVGDLELTNVRWRAPSEAQPWLNFTGASTLSNYICRQCVIYRNTTSNAAAFCALIPNGATVVTYDSDCQVVNEQGQSYSALSYLIDLQSGGAITNFVVPVYKLLSPTIFNGSQWSRVTNILGLNGTTYPVSSISGCTSAALGAGSLASGGTITGTPTGSCAATLTFQVPAAHGWSLQVNNRTHPGATNLIGQASTTATTAVTAGTTVSGDVLNFNASPY
jgi:hypothetical protein